MGFHSWSDFCRRTAPSPNEDASAETLKWARGSYSANMVGLASSFLIEVNFLMLGVHSQDAWG